MKSTFTFAVIFVTCFFSLQAQTLDSILLYETTEHFINQSPVAPSVYGELLELKPNFLRVYKFKDAATNKKIKYGQLSWALKYKGEDYFNMIYFDETNLTNTYYKMDLVGRYCVVLIDENEKIFFTDEGNYGLGLQGVLVSSIENKRRAKYNWKDKSGKKVNILLIDTQNILRQTADRNKGSSAYLMSKSSLYKTLKQLIPDLDSDKLNNFLIEDIIELIKKLNLENSK
jgi:hypothetical protein